MSDTQMENQFRLATTEMNIRIALLEDVLREKEKADEALQDSELRYRRLFESAKDGILILEAETGKVVDVNPFLLQLLGFSYEELQGQYIWELGVFKDIAASKDAFKTLQDNEYIRYDDLPLETHDGRPISVEFVSNVYLVDHSKVIQCNIRDITARKQGDFEHKQLMAAINQIGDGIVMTDVQGTIQFINPAFVQMTGFSREEVIGRNTRIFKSGEQGDQFYRTLWDTISGGKTWAGRMVNKRKDGSHYTVETTISPVLDASDRIVNYVSVKRDISDYLRLTAQYQQSQKLEAVGLLAGGVAHDYNNMLTVILCYAELALNKVEPTQPLHEYLEEIVKAAQRSAGITRQLLAFARKQAIKPVALDLNETVENTLKMLRRLIGEDINLAWLPTGGLCSIMMDPGQVDQILVNLCVNARDAIAGVGKITIETGNVVIDEGYCTVHAGYTVGKYVQLTVSDDGCGMEKDISDHIFEPFFTSKGVGQGTGLGLSTVYGIVKQNNGFINVYSEPGNGTSFKIYLPRHVKQANCVQQEEKEVIPVSCGETVLVVEDEPAILKMITMMLEKMGYTVLSADRPNKAIQLAEKHADGIDLLLSDVIMPEMNGRELAERIQSLCPNMKNVFMSGFTADVIAHRGVLDSGVHFIQKPFSLMELAVMLREALKET